LVSTPHVLSQISDLTDLSGNELTKIRKLFRILIGDIQEKFDTARTIAESPVFERLGLCDAAIQTVCAQDILVLTSDLQLHLALETRGADALNFNHVRQLQWAAN
jgi:hypothetical protein